MKRKWIYKENFGVIVNIEQEQQIKHVFSQSKPKDKDSGVNDLTFAEAVKMVKESGEDLKPILVKETEKGIEPTDDQGLKLLEGRVSVLEKLVKELQKGAEQETQAMEGEKENAKEDKKPEEDQGQPAAPAKVTAEQVGKWPKKVCDEFLKKNKQDIPEGTIVESRLAVIEFIGKDK